MSSKKHDINEFRRSARSEFLAEGEEERWVDDGGTDHNVRFTQAFNSVIALGQDKWLTSKQALQLTRTGAMSGKGKGHGGVADGWKMLLGPGYVKKVKELLKDAEVKSARQVYETLNPTGQCEVAATIFKKECTNDPVPVQLESPSKQLNFTTCWLCGGLILCPSRLADAHKRCGVRMLKNGKKSTLDKATPDCEHILPAMSAALFRGLFVNGASTAVKSGSLAHRRGLKAGTPERRGATQSPKLTGALNNPTRFKQFQIMTANNYLWGHAGCNRDIKSAYFPIKINDAKSAFVVDDEELVKMAKEIADYVGKKHPECLYGGQSAIVSQVLVPAGPRDGDEQDSSAEQQNLGKGYTERLKGFWTNEFNSPEWATSAAWHGGFKKVRDILGFQWPVTFGAATGMAFTAYNGTAFPYIADRPSKRKKIIVLVPGDETFRVSVVERLNKAPKWDGEFEVCSIKYAGKPVVLGGKLNVLGGEGAYKSPLSVYKTEYEYHVQRINDEYNQVRAAVVAGARGGGGGGGRDEASFRCYATYLLVIGRLYMATKKESKDFVIWDFTRMAAGKAVTKVHEGGGGKTSKRRIQYGGAQGVIDNLYDQMYDLQLYYTQEWSNIEYDILKMTNIKQNGGGVHIQKGGNKDISPSQIMNFFTYLLLGNNTDRKLALLNVTTDSNALASLWNPPKYLGVDTTRLPEPVVAVTCQIMSWILIWLQHGPEYLKKYNPSKKNSPIGGVGGDAVKNRALLTLGLVPPTTMGWKASPRVAATLRTDGSYTALSSDDYAVFINQICCLLNAAFRFIEASNLEGERALRSNYGKKIRTAALTAMGCKNPDAADCPDGDCANVNKTEIAKTLYYKAIMNKIENTIGFFTEHSLLRSNQLLADIKNCLKRYYCEEKWVELGLDASCVPLMTVSRGGYKRTKRKRRRKHTRRRRRHTRRRKTQRRKYRRRKKRKTKRKIRR